MPDRRNRTGYRSAELPPEMRRSVEAAVRRLSRVENPDERIKEAGDLLAALDEVLEEIAKVRLAAVAELRVQGWSYNRIADRTGLSKARAAQLARQARGNTGG